MPDLRSDLEALRDELCDNPPPQSCCDEAWIRARVQVVDSLDALLAAHTEAGEWRGPWKCERCEVTWDTKPDNHEWFDVPCGPVVPYERRKGGA